MPTPVTFFVQSMNNNIRYISTAFLLAISIAVYAQPKASYYNSIDGKKKEALKTAIKSIIVKHTKITYGKALEQAYESVYYRDDDRSCVYDMFSNEKYKFSANGWNKEHVVANSWWGGVKNNAYSDIFSVIPSETTANSRKSNYPLGEVKTISWTNDCIKIGTPKNGLGGSYKTVFEPADEYKGDFARIYFYVATCYDDINWGSNSNSKSEIVRETWPTLKPWLYEMLLRWHNADPVSAKEIQINNSAEKEQGNRNPFIDYPALADYIWNSQYYNTTFDLTSATLYKHISGDTPPTPPGPIDPDTTDVPPTPPIDDPVDFVPGDELFADSFDTIEQGNSSESSGSSAVWQGDDDFITVSTAYQAGGAVRLGSSKKTGMLITRTIDWGNRANLYVEFDLKGWSDADAVIQVSIGGVSKRVSSTHRLGDGYEHFSILFKDVNTPNTLHIETTSDSKRCFIDNVRVLEAKANPSTTVTRPFIIPTTYDDCIYNLSGQKVTRSYKGIAIRNGKKIIMR